MQAYTIAAVAVRDRSYLCLYIFFSPSFLEKCPNLVLVMFSLQWFFLPHVVDLIEAKQTTKSRCAISKHSILTLK